MKKQPSRDANAVNRALVIVVVCLTLAVIGILLYLLLSGGKPAETAKSGRDPNAAVGQIQGKTKEEIVAELNKIVEAGMFNISINSQIVFERGDGEGDVRIENIAANPYLMRVAITLDDTGETVYETGLLEPGWHIQNDVLDVPLSKGVYPATATFTACDPDTEAAIGQAAAKVTITVQN